MRQRYKSFITSFTGVSHPINPRNRNRAWALLGVLSGISLALSKLPGTADVVIWNAWVEQLNEHGFIAGYNAGVGYMIQPPLGMLLLWTSYEAPALLGIPKHLWPELGFTGYGVSLWLSLIVATLLVLRFSKQLWITIAFQGCFLLNSVVYGYFDLWGIIPLLLAVHAFSEDRDDTGVVWAVVASLIKWQFLLLLPFIFLYVVRKEDAVAASWQKKLRPMARLVAPSAVVLGVVLLILGRGTVSAFLGGLDHPVLSGQALNTSWLLTWVLHVWRPESYGTLEEGLIEVVRTRDTRIMAVIQGLVIGSYGLALWRCGRQAATLNNLLRYALAGYLAYFLFNKGAHENHLVPAILLAGCLAWYQPQWRWGLTLVALLANVNLLVFYTLGGSDRGPSRVIAGVDSTLPLAIFSVVALGVLLIALLWQKREIHAP